MNPSELTGVVLSAFGILVAFLGWRTSARTSDVARISAAVEGQKALIESLQTQVRLERDERIRLEQALRTETQKRQELEKSLEERDELIQQLRSDLEAARAKGAEHA